MFSSRAATGWLLAGALMLAPVTVFAADAEHVEHVPASEAGEDLQSYVPGAARLEGRIMAPCCWNQTIDIHGSEPAYELRREIRKRLKAGESSDAIEASLVQRFGPKILAVPDSSPLGSLATLLSIGFAGAGVAGYFMLRRWSRAGGGAATGSGDGTKPSKKKGGKASDGEPKRDDLDERLDRELSEIRDQA
jgi:cytochrome c-type biogenesis protein CcmH